MNFTYFIILCLVAANNVTAKSFTVVLDTTESMKEEINIIKANIASVIDVNNDRDIENYNIVPFNDPDVGPVISSFNSREFAESFSYIKTSGGEDCPENSLAGINTALEISSPLSYIFVFTDAFAKDYANVSAIMHLCNQKQSKVNIFLSGVCLTTRFNRKGDIDIYYEIAKACSGVVFQFDFYNLRQAFRYIKEIINTEWSDVTDYRSYDTISLPVNEYVQEMMIAVSSLKPLPDFDIVSASGQKPVIEKVVDARKTQVLKLNNPETGSYTFNVRSENILYVAAFVRSQVAFQYGFSTASPSNLLETTDKPIPGRVNYILIYTQTKITKVEMYTPSKKMITILEIEEITPGIHISRVYIENNQVIKIYVTFDDTDKQSKIPSATNFLCPQKTVYNASPQKPYIKKIEMENNIVDYGSEVRIATKVIGYPKPTIYWEDNNGDKLQSEDSILELPITYVSYVRIKNVRTNMTIYCKAQNSEGESTESYELYVKRPYSFEVIKTPEDTWIEYGSEGRLYCQVDAFPEARIQWYHNDSLITDTDNIKWIPDDNVLVINDMSLDDSGHYKCEMTNDIDTKSFSAQISISGIEAPKVELAKTEVTLMLDDSTEIECRILQGKPAPAVTWWYKSDTDYDYDYNLPSGVTSENEQLKITSANMEHKGTYKCVATNIIGSDSSEVILKIEFTPIIKDSEETTMVVTEGDPVEMSCDVMASPKAIVRWEMSQDDLIIRFDERHTTDDRHVHRFNALWKDSGNYHCIAENTIGKAEKTIILNVLVAPYIETPKNKYISGRIGDEIMLPCNVLYGNPAPSIKWEFIAMDSPVVTLKRGNSTNTLHIMKLTRSNEGTYMCVAENRAGIDSIKYYVKVQ